MKFVIYFLIGAFVLSGVAHLVSPESFLWLMPPWLPEPILLIYISGIFELLAAVGLVLRQKWAGWFSALLLLAIWPANIWYAISVTNSGDVALIAAAWLRLPLQIPLMYYSWRFSKSLDQLGPAEKKSH